MARETAPPGDTFKDRWPDEVAETAWLAGPWIPVVLGALAGLFAVPVILISLVAAWAPLSMVVLGTLVALATLGLVRTRGALQRWSGRLWRLATWVSLAAGLGLLIGVLTSLLCTGADCATGGFVDPQHPLASVIVFGASFLGSIAIAIGVDRAARRLAGMR